MVCFEDRGVFKLDVCPGKDELVYVQGDVVSTRQSHEFADRCRFFGQPNIADIERPLADVPAVVPESRPDRISGQDF